MLGTLPEASSRTSAPISSGSIILPVDRPAILGTCSRNSSVVIPSRRAISGLVHNRVRTGPGEMVFTVRPCELNSSDSDLLMLASAALAAE